MGHSVGHTPTHVHTTVTDALSRLFSGSVAVEAEEDEIEEENEEGKDEDEDVGRKGAQAKDQARVSEASALAGRETAGEKRRSRGRTDRQQCSTRKTTRMRAEK